MEQLIEILLITRHPYEKYYIENKKVLYFSKNIIFKVELLRKLKDWNIILKPLNIMEEHVKYILRYKLLSVDMYNEAVVISVSPTIIYFCSTGILLMLIIKLTRMLKQIIYMLSLAREYKVASIELKVDSVCTVLLLFVNFIKRLLNKPVSNGGK